MAFLTTDYSNNKRMDFDPLPTGEYEIIITKAEERQTRSGAESLQLQLTIRNDLDQLNSLQKKFHNRIVFMDNWKRRATNEYDMNGFQYIVEAVNIPEGTQLESVNDFCKALTGRPAKVYVKKTTDRYNGEVRDVNRVAPWNFDKTEYPDVQHKFKDDDPYADSTEPVDINNDDLPF